MSFPVHHHVRARPHRSVVPHGHRRGSLLTEMVVITVVMGVVATVFLPALHGISGVSRSIQFEQLARIELNNIQQRLAATGLAPEPSAIDSLQTGEWFRERYPKSELHVEQISGPEAQPSAGLIPLRMTLSESRDSMRPAAAVSIVVWIPAAEETTP